MSLCTELLEQPEPRGHVVQFYEADERLLVANVSRYLAEGLTRGDSALIVATEGHQAAFLAGLEELGTDVTAALGTGRLTLLDGEKTLAQFLVNEYPDADRFERVIGSTLRQALEYSNGSGLRVYGEMVGILWKARQYPAAIRLEQLWNKLRKSYDFDLFCAYSIDIFDKQLGILDALLCAHTHLLPFGANGDLDHAVDRAMDEVLGARAAELRTSIDADSHTPLPAMPRAEALILWLRNNLPENVDAILTRARKYYGLSA